MSGKSVMVEAQAPTDPIRRAYNFYSYFYHLVGAPLERKPRLRGLDLADIQPRDKVLEVAVGPGATLLEILKRVPRDNVVRGIDLSPKMLRKAYKHVTRAGYVNIDLREADARNLPFPDSTFDVLYNSYMLDLIPLGDMPILLAEFSRVLRPGGRLVLVNLSKPDPDTRTWYERFYTWAPKRLVPYVFGGCRPVLMEGLIRDAGFEGVTREYIPHVVPSEVAIARKPAAEKPQVADSVRGVRATVVTQRASLQTRGAYNE